MKTLWQCCFFDREYYQRCKGLFHDVKRVNLLRNHRNPTCVANQCALRNRKNTYWDSWDFNHLCLLFFSKRTNPIFHLLILQCCKSMRSTASHRLWVQWPSQQGCFGIWHRPRHCFQWATFPRLCWFW